MIRPGYLSLIVAGVVLLGLTLAVYLAGLAYPFDTRGEGAKPENYPW